MNLTALGFNNFLLKEGVLHWIIHKAWYAIKVRTKLRNDYLKWRRKQSKSMFCCSFSMQLFNTRGKLISIFVSTECACLAWDFNIAKKQKQKQTKTKLYWKWTTFYSFIFAPLNECLWVSFIIIPCFSESEYFSNRKHKL